MYYSDNVITISYVQSYYYFICMMAKTVSKVSMSHQTSFILITTFSKTGEMIFKWIE